VNLRLLITLHGSCVLDILAVETPFPRVLILFNSDVVLKIFLGGGQGPGVDPTLSSLNYLTNYVTARK